VPSSRSRSRFSSGYFVRLTAGQGAGSVPLPFCTFRGSRNDRLIDWGYGSPTPFFFLVHVREENVYEDERGGRIGE
jgi:hypothetical protein